MKLLRKCSSCGKDMLRKYPTCEECYKNYKKGKTYLKCNNCGKKFKKPNKYGMCIMCYTKIERSNTIDVN